MHSCPFLMHRLDDGLQHDRSHLQFHIGLLTPPAMPHTTKPACVCCKTDLCNALDALLRWKIREHGTSFTITTGDQIGVGTPLQLSSNCTGAAADLALSSQGILRHQYSGLCVGPNPAAPSTTPPPPPPEGSGAIESIATGGTSICNTFKPLHSPFPLLPSL